MPGHWAEVSLDVMKQWQARGLVALSVLAVGCGDDAGVSGNSSDPGAPTRVVYQEIDGLLAVEAEGFTAVTSNDKPRQWVLTSAERTPSLTPDPDPPHVDGASGGAYLELLPDTRVTDEDPIQEGESIFNQRGTGPTLSYDVYFDTAGTYYVWVRAYSTGGEDNGIHVGLDGEWPDSGFRIQFCRGKNQWTWSSALRDSRGEVCGVPYSAQIVVEEPGAHVVSFSAREDGFELDKWVMSTDDSFEPEGEGPPTVTR